MPSKPEWNDEETVLMLFTSGCAGPTMGFWMDKGTHRILLAVFRASPKYTSFRSDQDLGSAKLSGDHIFADHLEMFSHVVTQG